MMHTFIKNIHKHILLASVATLAVAMGSWMVDGYFSGPQTSAAQGSVDVSLSIIPYPTVVNNGSVGGFLLYYKTIGSATASGIQVQATLPVGMSVTSAVPNTYTQEGNTLTWSGLPDNYGPVLLEVQVNTSGSTQLTLAGNVSTTSNDINLSNNTKSASITVMDGVSPEYDSDMSITVATNSTSPEAGSEITYTMTYENNGPDVAEEVLVVLTLPEQLVYLTGSKSPNTSIDNTLVWQLYDVGVGEEGIITAKVLLSNITEPGDVLFSYATVSSVNADSSPLNNQAEKSITVATVQNGSQAPSTPGAQGGAGEAAPAAPTGAGAGSEDVVPQTTETEQQQEDVLTQDNLPTTSGFLFAVTDVDMSIPAGVTCASSQELQSAYTFAHSNSITTMPSLAQARMCDGVIRSELAKMISNYAINVLGKTPDTSVECAFNDMATQPQDLQDAAITACQLGLMGLDADGNPVASFNPKQTVTRSIFGTAFSRLLYGDTYNIGGSTWYEAHLDALSDDGIIKNITPSLQELRGYIMIMMQRSQK